MIVYYPSYSFETLVTGRTEMEARELLAAWSAAFHPALIEWALQHSANPIPRWESASNSANAESSFAENNLVLVPPCCETNLSREWFVEQEAAGVRFVRGLADRTQITARLLEEHGIEQASAAFDEEFVRDFQALGTVYFLVDLLVQQLHYTSALDDTQFCTKMFDAVVAYKKGDKAGADDFLCQAFETASQSKEYFYPVQTYFLDLVLVTPETTGLALQNLLQTGNVARDRTTLFLPALLLQKIAESEPDTLAALKSASETGRIRFIVDDTEETSLLLLPLLDQADRILEGLSIYREILNISPSIYGCQHTGLHPLLPQLLQLTGMKGAVHFAPLDGWHLKNQDQSKMMWKGVECRNPDSDYYRSLLNIDDNSYKRHRIVCEGCRHGKRRLA